MNLNLHDFIALYCLEPESVQPGLYAHKSNNVFSTVNVVGYVPDNQRFVSTELCVVGATQALLQIFSDDVPMTPARFFPLAGVPIPIILRFEPRSKIKITFASIANTDGQISVRLNGYFVNRQEERLVHRTRVLGFFEPPTITGTGQQAPHTPPEPPSIFAINTIDVVGDATSAIALELFRFDDENGWERAAVIEPANLATFVDSGVTNADAGTPRPQIAIEYRYKARYTYPENVAGEFSNTITILVPGPS
jgi:hypothetical protein